MDTIERAIGREVRRLRVEAGVGQSALAAAARQYGAPWTRAMIAAIELGRKQLSLGEVVLLALVLREAGVTRGRRLTIGDLIPVTEEPVTVGPGYELSLRLARALLLEPETSEEPAKPVTVGADRRALEAAADAEQKAAVTLGVTPEAIVQAAYQRWGRSLTARRDAIAQRREAALVHEDPEETRSADWPRRVQAIRGAATRELLEELRPLLKGTTKKKRSRS
jgi:transcriptional regulator with XRE-family HTH domain